MTRRTFYVPPGIDWEKQFNAANDEARKGKKVEFHNHGISERTCNDHCWSNY